MPAYVDTILCDMIRKEANNKVSLLGVFGKAIFVPKIPTQLATLAIIQRWEPTADEQEGTNFTFTLEIRGPGFKEPIRLERQMSVVPGPYTQMSIAMQIQGFPIPARGDYQLVTFIDGEERHTYNFFVSEPTEEQLRSYQLTGFR